MLMRFKNFCCLMATVAMLGIGIGSAGAQDSDVDVDNGALEISTDDTHDLVMIGIENDEVIIHILQYNVVDFDDVPNIFAYSEEELIDMADEYRYEDRDLDDINYMILETRGGNDVVFIDNSFNLISYTYLGAGDDFIQTGSGSSYVWGDDGEDRIDGEDAVYLYARGGPQNDRIYGGSGGDSLYGDGDDDRLYGKGGNDFMFGGEGNDRLYGHDGNDYLRGNAGNDRLYGHDGNDSMYGDQGDDQLFGHDGDDYLRGGDHDDLLDGGYDGYSDRMRGDTGADTFRDPYYQVVEITYYVPYYSYEYVNYGGFIIPRWVLRYQEITVNQNQTVEEETIYDFDANQGDVRQAIEVN